MNFAANAIQICIYQNVHVYYNYVRCWYEKIQLNNTIAKFTRSILLYHSISFYNYNTKITCYLSVVQTRFNLTDSRNVSFLIDNRNDKIIH